MLNILLKRKLKIFLLRRKYIKYFAQEEINIARGTMDPKIDSVTHQQLTQQPHGSICTSFKFGHQRTPLIYTHIS